MLFMISSSFRMTGNVKELVNDMAELKPTFLIGVPRVFQRYGEHNGIHT